MIPRKASQGVVIQPDPRVVLNSFVQAVSRDTQVMRQCMHIYVTYPPMTKHVVPFNKILDPPLVPTSTPQNCAQKHVFTVNYRDDDCTTNVTSVLPV